MSIWMPGIFLKVKESYRSKNEKDFGLEVTFKDFREIDGVMFPFYHDIHRRAKRLLKELK